jgi:AcrR family transcriptional regulator
MSSGFSLDEDVRRLAEQARPADDVRYDNGEPRRLGAKGRRTRAAILRAAGDAFADRGWGATTMATVAERAQVGTGTIYQYFRSKEEVLTALVGEWALVALGQLRAWDPAGGVDGLRTLIGRFVHGYATTASFQRVWEEVSLTDPSLGQLRADISELYVQLFAEAFAAGRSAGLLDAEPDPVEAARALSAMVDRYCHLVFVQHAVDRTPDEVAELLTGLWARAIELR